MAEETQIANLVRSMSNFIDNQSLKVGGLAAALSGNPEFAVGAGLLSKVVTGSLNKTATGIDKVSEGIESLIGKFEQKEDEEEDFRDDVSDKLGRQNDSLGSLFDGQVDANEILEQIRDNTEEFVRITTGISVKKQRAELDQLESLRESLFAKEPEDDEFIPKPEKEKGFFDKIGGIQGLLLGGGIVAAIAGLVTFSEDISKFLNDFDHEKLTTNLPLIATGIFGLSAALGVVSIGLAAIAAPIKLLLSPLVAISTWLITKSAAFLSSAFAMIGSSAVLVPILSVLATGAAAVLIGNLINKVIGKDLAKGIRELTDPDSTTRQGLRQKGILGFGGIDSIDRSSDIGDELVEASSASEVSQLRERYFELKAQEIQADINHLKDVQARKQELAEQGYRGRQIKKILENDKERIKALSQNQKNFLILEGELKRKGLIGQKSGKFTGSDGRVIEFDEKGVNFTGVTKDFAPKTGGIAPAKDIQTEAGTRSVLNDGNDVDILNNMFGFPADVAPTPTDGGERVANADGERRNISQLSISEKGKDFIRQFEAPGGKPILKAYKDTDGNYAIGFGTQFDRRGGQMKRIHRGMTITEAEAHALFEADLKKREAKLKSYLGNSKLTQGEFDAMMSLAFNYSPEGLSKTKGLKSIKAGDVEQGFMQLFGPNGIVNAGEHKGLLAPRRATEARDLAGIEVNPNIPSLALNGITPSEGTGTVQVASRNTGQMMGDLLSSLQNAKTQFSLNNIVVNNNNQTSVGGGASAPGTAAGPQGTSTVSPSLMQRLLS